MATITPNTFDSLRRYVSVRLQQGVPIVDADWNEKEDIRRFEVRAFLKWFVGNGIPEQTNGFQIEGTGLANDFFVRAGITGPPDGLANVGRCLVDGADLLITTDVQFTLQPLHQGQPGSAALAAALGVLPIPALPTPAADGDVTVLVDTWEHLVTPTAEPALVHPGLNTESCARLRREWVIRSRDGAGVPVPGDPDFEPGHSYCALARIRRRAGDALVQSADVTDLRERRLLVPPAQLVEDLFGVTAVEYRQGLGRPLVSLREAINALLRGDLPSSVEAAIAPSLSPDLISRGTFFDSAGGLVTVWRSDRTGPAEVFLARLSLAAPAAGFATVQQVTNTGRANPHAALLSSGEYLLVYESTGGAEDVLMKRGALPALTTALAETTVTATAARERRPFAVPVGSQAVLFWHSDAANRWQFIRYDVATAAFPSPAADLATNATNQFDFHAAADAGGTVWSAFQGGGPNNDILVVPLPAAAPPGAVETLSSSGTVVDQHPFVVVDGGDNVWIFWAGSGASAGIWSRRFLRPANVWEAAPGTQVPGTFGAGAGTVNLAPTAAVDPDGGVWLFWRSDRSGNQDLWYVRRSPDTGAWGAPRQVTGSTDPDITALALFGPDGSLWLFWQRNLAGTTGELFFRQIFPSI